MIMMMMGANRLPRNTLYKAAAALVRAPPRKGGVLTSFGFQRSSISTSTSILQGHSPTTSSSIKAPADHSWRQLNHIWNEDEIDVRIQSASHKHEPQGISDHLMRGVMRTMYHSFNFITGYKHENPSAESIEWRLIILESFAGVPGFLAAGFRHFYSIRNLKRDHGMIFTLLEEAENERMHLLTCLKMFNAGMVTRSLVIATQFGMTPFLFLVYSIHPQSMHRFVGYLEETAVETYANIVHHVETPGTQLHAAWGHLEAPDIAISYWQLEEGRQSWTDALKCMLADEAHHRDVNHALASLPSDAENPFIHEHMQNFDDAAVRRAEFLLKEAIKNNNSSSSKPKNM
jgi:hypothetical protein